MFALLKRYRRYWVAPLVLLVVFVVLLLMLGGSSEETPYIYTLF